MSMTDTSNSPSSEGPTTAWNRVNEAFYDLASATAGMGLFLGASLYSFRYAQPAQGVFHGVLAGGFCLFAVHQFSNIKRTLSTIPAPRPQTPSLP